MNLKNFKQLFNFYEQYLDSADYRVLPEEIKAEDHAANVRFLNWILNSEVEDLGNEC